MSLQLAAIFRSAHAQLKPRSPVPDMHVEFFPYAGLSHSARFRNERLFIRVSDLLCDAPQHILQALALILLGKVYRRRVDEAHRAAYRGFILGVSIQERARTARTSRGRGPRPLVTRGRCRDLDEHFDRLNAGYFGNGLARPRLTWSATPSRHVLGRYDAAHDTVFISRIFDSAAVPEFVLDYVLYHELLHIQHPSRARDCRRVTHTPEFRTAERQFREYEKASEWLQKL